MNEKTNTRRRRLTIIGVTLMAVGVVVSLSHIEAGGDVMQFIAAASPWLLLGLGAACTLSGAAQ